MLDWRGECLSVGSILADCTPSVCVCVCVCVERYSAFYLRLTLSLSALFNSLSLPLLIRLSIIRPHVPFHWAPCLCLLPSPGHARTSFHRNVCQHDFHFFFQSLIMSTCHPSPSPTNNLTNTLNIFFLRYESNHISHHIYLWTCIGTQVLKIWTAHFHRLQ